MREPRYAFSAGPAALSCLAAGPIFVGSVALLSFVGIAARSPLNMSGLTPAFLLGLVAILPLVVAFGGILAIIPVAIGSALLRQGAEVSDAAAEPVTWISAGALLAGTAGWLLGGQDAEPIALAALALTGAACAGLSRRGLTRVVA